MFDIGWQELFLIGVVALVVVGPKDLPRVLRTAARFMQKARAMSREFQAGLAEMAREAELDEIRQKVETAVRFDPDGELQRQVDPTGKLTDDFDPVEFSRRMREAPERDVAAGAPLAQTAATAVPSIGEPTFEYPLGEPSPAEHLPAGSSPRPPRGGEAGS
jgi:sec-independent protein translocase protein TatB